MKKKIQYSNTKKRERRHLGVVALLITIVSFQVFAQSSDQLRQQLQEGAEQYLRAAIGDRFQNDNVQITVLPIDQRIQIQHCDSGYHYQADEGALSQSYVSVRVSCPSSNWYLFTNGRIARTRTVVVTAGMISPGTVLSAQNLTLSEVDVNLIRHTSYTDLTPLIGARMKRRVRQGQAIQGNMLCFVCKGDRITISANAAGMQVKTAGIAQQDGVIGDNIQVLNASSRKSIIAEVASTQTVIVNL
ncbi:flagellar basal body P-ring formation chaperone FlgA [Alteromonas sp. C1M14]|uniref:flagellar basal body P-ring formation chaperone FlgA n=1 Tax=Alteromonas sp. C1M14 TaxID=2841567 RepID=UPI001C09EB46|nr:flagellar basal body P-ring formation chaperone FlgA [Alteromonas sp. C1M14]MBU2977917.1 flagellar basal body P-ring formation protein FlgA [Alteromonas sp. C1M14]